MTDVSPKKSRAAGKSVKTTAKKNEVLGVPDFKNGRTFKATQKSNFYKDIVETIREPLLVLNSDLRVLFANQKFYSSFKVTTKKTIGNLVYDLGNQQWNIPSLRILLEEILPKKNRFNNFQIEHDFPAIGKRIMLLNARRIVHPLEKQQLILLAIEDVTERILLEKALQESEERFRRAFETAQDGILLNNKKTGQIINSNPAAQKLLGYSQTELQKQRLWKFGFLKNADQFHETVRQLKKLGFVNFNDTFVKTKEGREIPADVYFVDKTKLVQCNIRDVTERKMLDDKMSVNEDRYHALFQHISSGVAVYEALDDGSDFIFKDYNAAAERIDKTPRASVIGRKVSEVFPGIREMGLLDTFQRVWKTGKPKNHPLSIYKDEHLMGWRENYVYKLPSGEIVAVYEDCTDRKKAELAIAKSESKFKWLYINAPIPYHILSADGIIIDINQRWCEMLGYTREEALGRDLFDFIVEEEREAAKISFKNKKVSKKTYFEGNERNYRTKNGVIKTFKTYDFLVFDQNQNITSIQTTIEDITERKQAEERFRKENELKNIIIQTSPVAITMVDRDGVIKFANPHAEQILGLTKDKLATMHYNAPQFQISDNNGDDFPDEQLPFARVRATLKPVNGIQHTIIYPNKKRILLSINAAPVFDEKGFFDGMVASLEDITERKQAEAQLQEYSQNLETMVEERTRELQVAHEKLMRQERLATMGQLAGSVGHELRNPLNVISSSVYLLKKTLGGIDEKSQEYLDIIKQETDKSAKIIKDLLDFGRKSMANTERVKVSAIVAQAITRNTPPENIKVISADIPDATEIMVDAQQVGQVLDNLITNAFQAMPAGGKLTIKAIKKKDHVNISIADTGTGISKENLDRLFEPLFTTKTRGIGLGLALSKNYVEANGGSIAVESEENKGSTFTISFKLNQAQ
jgi:PAS domain S-box-containing protein